MSIMYCGKGDILKSRMQTIVIPVNIVGVMGSGLACWFRNNYPSEYAKYRKHCFKGEFKMGMLLHFNIGNKIYLLLPTKEHWNKDSKPEYIEQSLVNLVSTYRQRGITSLSIPPLGSGLGKLNFETQVKPLLYKYLDSLDIPVEIMQL